MTNELEYIDGVPVFEASNNKELKKAIRAYKKQTGIKKSFDCIVRIGKKTTVIEEYAFEGQNDIVEVIIHDSVTTIGKRAFKYCGYLKSVNIPDSVTTIEEAAFYDCEGLTSITIPDSVTLVGDSAFSSCENLDSVTILGSTGGAGNPFVGCNSLKAIYGKYASADNRCWIENDKLCFIAPKGLTEFAIPGGVTSIGMGAFDCCKYLESVIIPNSVTSIGSRAFRSCEKLTNLIIPNSVTSIGRGAFENCKSLTNINIPNSITSIEDNTFAYCYKLTDVTIPDSVTTIGDDAFHCCQGLTSITIPNSVTSVGDDVFGGWDMKLETIIAPSRLVFDELPEGTLVVESLDELKPTIIQNAKVRVEVSYLEYEYVAFDSDENSMLNTFAYCASSKSVSDIKIYVNGELVADNDEDAKKLMGKSIVEKSVSINPDWGGDESDVKTVGYLDNKAYVVWEFERNELNLRKLRFVYDESYLTAPDHNDWFPATNLLLQYDGETLERLDDEYYWEDGSLHEIWRRE